MDALLSILPIGRSSGTGTDGRAGERRSSTGRTSGTTSEPKGVVHCHRGLFLITLDSLVEWAVPPQPTYLWTLPMFHANGWSFPWGMAVVGGTNVCLRRVDAGEVYAAIVARGVDHLCGAPVVLNMLANAPDGVRRPLPARKKARILTAGAPPPAAVLHRMESIGFEVSHGYGLTETAGLVVCCAWKREWNRLPAAERARLKASGRAIRARSAVREYARARAGFSKLGKIATYFTKLLEMDF